jgi:predicted RNA-binding Zn-ribbon protein involved in translation (DUF1610 family)
MKMPKKTGDKLFEPSIEKQACPSCGNQTFFLYKSCYGVPSFEVLKCTKCLRQGPPFVCMHSAYTEALADEWQKQKE